MNAYKFRGELDRAWLRLDNAIRERDRFEEMMDADDERAERHWRKLNEDVEKAERDVGHAQHALAGE